MPTWSPRGAICAFGAAFFGAVAGVGAAASQEASWRPMAIDASDAQAGVLSGYYVVRELPVQGTADNRDGLAVASLPGVAASRDLADGIDLDGARYRVVRLGSDAEATAFLAAASAHEGVSVQPVIVGRSTASGSDSGLPNDPFLSHQYAIDNRGQTVGGTPGLPGADVRVARAWDLQRGLAQVRVAVIDVGVSQSHPDLASKLDAGVNVTTGATSDTDAPLNTHGTHIAGIIGASTNNAEGVVGVSWGSRIVPVKAANPLGFTSDVWLAEGLIWAAENGVDVAVMSYGLSARSDVLADAVRFAVDRGVIVVASAGNSGAEGVLYPGAYPEVIAVGATDNVDALASFSTRGPEVELVAPGVDILSTTHTAFDPHSYGLSSGTSVATPVVAGVAALIRSADPDISVEAVRRALARTSRDLGGLGRDDSYGYGRVNAYRALQEVLGIAWCYADVDGDGVVQPTDFSAWMGIYSNADPRADQNNDGQVTPADLNAFIRNYFAQQGVCGSD